MRPRAGAGAFNYPITDTNSRTRDPMPDRAAFFVRDGNDCIDHADCETRRNLAIPDRFRGLYSRTASDSEGS